MPRRWVSVNVLILGCALGVMPSALAISLDFVTFDAPGATGTYARGINGAGQIVGDFVDAGNKSHGLTWSPRHRLFYIEGAIVGAGLGIHYLQVTRKNLSPAWNRPNTGRCEFVTDVLVCEAWYKLATGPYGRAGVVALEPDTGKELWRRTGPAVDDEQVVGEGNFAALTMRPQGPASAPAGALSALRPRDGRTLWSVPLPLGEAKSARIRSVAGGRPRRQTTGRARPRGGLPAPISRGLA